MTDNELLVKTRNLIRYIFREMSDEIDIKARDDSKFFFDLMKKCVEVGVVNEYGGTYRLTSKEKEEGHQKGARHRGHHVNSEKTRAKNTPYYRKEDQGV